jgi:hypothetical protein
MARGVAGRFDLRGPCEDCPFRKDKPFYLGGRRAREIADSIVKDDTGFTCHKTVIYDYDEDGNDAFDVMTNGRACGGVMVMLEKMQMPSQEMRVAHRLGMFDHTKLDMDAPVFDTMNEWVEFQEGLLR